MSRRGLFVSKRRHLWSAHLFITNFQCYQFLLDLSGYIHQVTPTKDSPTNNPYFDSIATETSVGQIRIMINPTVNRNLFLEMCETKTPITFKNLSKSSKRRIALLWEQHNTLSQYWILSDVYDLRSFRYVTIWKLWHYWSVVLDGKT